MRRRHRLRRGGLCLAVGIALLSASCVPLVQPSTGPAPAKPASIGGSGVSSLFRLLIASSRDLGVVRNTRVILDLRLRDRPSNPIATTLDRMYDPSDRWSGSIHPTSGVLDQFGPPERFIRSVTRLLQSAGLTVRWTPEQPWLTAGGRAQMIDRMFRVHVRRYRASNGTTFVASARDPSVPMFLRRYVAGIGRICTYVWLRRATVAAGGLSPRGMLAAYDIAPLRSLGLDGRGVTVVFPEIDGVDSAATSRFAQVNGLPPFNISFKGASLKSGDEATMDVEVVHAIAPRAKLVVFNFNGQVTNSQWTSQTLSMVRASAGDVISSSVGSCDGGYNSTDATDFATVLNEADVLRESMFASAGDNGAFDCIGHGQTPGSAYVGVDMPAALPGVTGVGGTSVTVSPSGSWQNETVWEGPIETAGTGGGISRFFTQPTWQVGPGVAAADQINTARMRMVPDISADADPGTGMNLIFPAGSGQGGGTSQAAPIWAAITALIDEYLRVHGHQPVGFMNPALYYLARTHPAFAPFHDVTVGTNLYYFAGPGYDMASGLGSPDAWNLARDLLRYQARRGL